MALLEKAQSGNGHGLVTMLVVSRLISDTVFSFVGGVLADYYDRKHMMLILDVIGVFVSLLYLQSTSSVVILYICAILQAALAGLYEPSRSAILPSLVGPEYLDKANQMTVILWSVASAAGSTMGGFIVHHYGVNVCFLVDSSFYLFSAIILAVKLKGEYSAITCDDETQNEEPGLRDLLNYLKTNDTSSYLFIKCSGALMYGAASVLNVSFAQVDGLMDSERLGWMFFAIGIGSLFSPLVMIEGRCYRTACAASFAMMGAGYIFLGWSEEFWLKCLWTGVKAMGSGLLWVDSTILLQAATPDRILGRISSIDFALAALGEGGAAVIVGCFQEIGMSADRVAVVVGAMSIGFAYFWTWMFFRRSSVTRRSKTLADDIELQPLQDATIA